MRLSWMIGGAQGLGVDTSANLFGSAVAKSGYYLYGSREYYSNIKGRHSYFNVTISDEPANSISDKVNILATFDSESVFQHFREAKDFIIYSKPIAGIHLDTVRSIETEIMDEVKWELESNHLDTTVGGAIQYAERNGAKAIAIDYVNDLNKIINALGMEPALAERAKNIIAIAASYSLLGLDKKHLMDSITSRFSKSNAFLQLNTMAAEIGLAYASSSYNLQKIDNDAERVQVDGNTLAAMGKMIGGLRFQSYYPITPASDESTYIEANQVVSTQSGEENGIVVLQTEDELAAINSAIGAALTGARSATATSGPGFSLMAEGISWAGMNEVPVLVTYYMRGAPATGLPTRSGQGDLRFAINVGHGEFPRIVIASGTHTDVYKDSILALNLAERYQTPAIHIVEKSLANAYSTIKKTALGSEGVAIERGSIEKDLQDYKRFKITEDGVSPRAFLGQTKMFYTGDEHNEHGHISEASMNRLKMYEKRMKKLDKMELEIPEEERLRVIGNGDIGVLTWGSPIGALMDCIDELAAEGIEMQVVQVKMFSPYPSIRVKELLKGKKKVIAIENNYSAQGAQVFREKTGMEPTSYILKWTGRPMTKEEVADGIRRIVKEDTERIVLHGGA